MISEHDIEKIERYLNGMMDEAEREAFERDVSVSADDYKAAVKAVELYNREQLKSRLKDLFQ